MRLSLWLIKFHASYHHATCFKIKHPAVCPGSLVEGVEDSLQIAMYVHPSLAPKSRKCDHSVHLVSHIIENCSKSVDPSPWGVTEFDWAHMNAVGKSFTLRDGSNEGSFVAFGDVVCFELHISWYNHIRNRMDRRISVNWTRRYQFSHVTLAKLEGGRLANKLWH